jgi:hypothetical protein
MPWQANGWIPTTVTRHIRSLATSTGVAIVDTDCGEGFLKSLGNPEGPHVLGCEFVGSLLADWIGLATLDFAIVQVMEDDEIPLGTGGYAVAGPAFISRSVTGTSWGGDVESLQNAANAEDVTRLVIFDTWVRNCDRYRPQPQRCNLDNVFCVHRPENARHPVLTAIDHTHTFTCGREITKALGHIDVIQDPMVYGAFPAFFTLWNLAAEAAIRERLQDMDLAKAQEFVSMVPFAWLPDQEVRAVWARFIHRRAEFLAAGPLPVGAAMA